MKLRWQASTVSRSMRAAARSALASAGDLDLCYTHRLGWQHMRLDSALLLSWATAIGHLHLDDVTLHVPGLPAFARAAGDKLSYVQVSCSSVLATMQAGHMLSSCSGQVALHLAGSHAPSALPPNMLSLRVDLVIFPNFNLQPHYDPLTPHALVYSAARHCAALKDVSLAFREAQVELSCSVLLPRLDRLRIELSLRENTTIDLSWLQLQPCNMLEVKMEVATGPPGQHELAVSQLQHLPVHVLTVRWQVPLTPDLQLIWQRKFSCKLIRLEIHAPMLDALQALPRPYCLSIEVVCNSDLSVHWAAAASSAARICFVGPGHKIHFLGGCSIPDSKHGAWQLSVFSSAASGLQGAAETDGMHYLQNDAATEAEWKRAGSVSLKGWLYSWTGMSLGREGFH